MARPAELTVGTRANDPGAGNVREAVIQYLSPLPGVEVDVALELNIRVPGGIGQRGVCGVSENANLLGLAANDVEEE